MDWLLIADDLTGACDTGGAFTGPMQTVKVVLDLSQGFPAADVLVFSTESRSLTPDGAVDAVTLLFEFISPGPGCKIYKKIDSTLRGHPWIELAEVMKHFNCEQVLLAPAFPEQGRTVQQGILYVNGIPLEQTTFAVPGAASLLDGLAERNMEPRLIPVEDVRKGASWVGQLLQDGVPGVVVADAETATDLRVLARAFLESGLRLACGSAGLARALAGETGQSGRWQPAVSVGGPTLVIAGSRHPATLKQVAAAKRNSVQVIAPEFSDLRVASEKARLVQSLCQALTLDKQAILSASAFSYAAGQEKRVAQELTSLAHAVMDSVPVGNLVLTGGDIAAAVCRELRCRAIHLGGEILPGMVWGILEGGSTPGVGVVTKAGGFGEEDALVIALAFLARGILTNPLT